MTGLKLVQMVLSICFLQAGGMVAAIPMDPNYLNVSYKHEEVWRNWKQTHSKNYTDVAEDLLRHLTWLSNMKFIEMHNANAHIFGFKLAMNHLGDLTETEYASGAYCYMKMTDKEKASLRNFRVYKSSSHLNTSYPDAMDWRTKGAVGSVKNQWYGVCSSCYAFAAMGALEGANALSKGYFLSLSEQNIVDCSVPYGNYGCSGGNVYNSFTYVIANNGVDTDGSYPYMGRQSQCVYSSDYRGATQRGIVAIASGDESSLMSAVYSAGPIAIAVDGRSNAFKFYYSGVFDSSRCTTTYLTHSLLVTGYGTYGGKNYFLVKNSWGENWGMNGYILMTRNGYNQCGIASDASFPTL